MLSKRLIQISAIVMLLSTLTGCFQEKTTSSFVIKPHLGESASLCDKEKNQWVISDFRFFAHEFSLLNDKGQWIKSELASKPPWQNEQVVLFDFETGNLACSSGNPDINQEVYLNFPKGKYTHIRFTLGVPFTLNHQNPATAESPLNLTAMHWHWQGGYKFLRIAASSQTKKRWFHLGSTQCMGTIGNITECKEPNRYTVEMPINQEALIKWDVSSLVKQLTSPSSSEEKCMADKDNDFCQELFSSLKNMGASE